ncbi:MAG: dihydroorotase [Proteobacteria bacterium SG_bin7]|nr:MAG: dihydroorotase [Proteobacteria bacterium SG_bin7]
MQSSQYFDLVIKSGKCLIKNKSINDNFFQSKNLDIGIVHNKIEKIGDIPASQAKQIIDAKNLFVLPGVIDSQVHFREPGLEHKEDLFSGTKAAALGGVTTVFEMPNTKPPTVSVEEFKKKLDLTRDRIWINCGFYVGATIENIDELAKLETLPGCVGVKMFMGLSTGTLLVREESDVEKVIKAGKRRMAIHAEDDARLEERKKLLGGSSTVHLHPEWRDAESALIATRRAVTLAKKHNRPIHILHVTSKDEMQFLADHKKSGLISLECTPQHLTLFAPDCYDSLNTYAQMNPPIRSREHFLGLWKAMENGVVDVIGSDHAPHSHEEKQKKYPNSPSGMTGVQTLLPIMLDHVNQNRLSLEQLVPLISYNPARLFGLQNKGLICEGFDADLTLIDLKAERVITNEWIASKCGWTPFHGRKVKGWPICTIVNGSIVMKDDQILGTPIGKIASFGNLAQ